MWQVDFGSAMAAMGEGGCKPHAHALHDGAAYPASRDPTAALPNRMLREKPRIQSQLFHRLPAALVESCIRSILSWFASGRHNTRGVMRSFFSPAPY